MEKDELCGVVGGGDDDGHARMNLFLFLYKRRVRKF